VGTNVKKKNTIHQTAEKPSKPSRLRIFRCAAPLNARLSFCAINITPRCGLLFGFPAFHYSITLHNSIQTFAKGCNFADTRGT